MLRKQKPNANLKLYKMILGCLREKKEQETEMTGKLKHKGL